MRLNLSFKFFIAFLATSLTIVVVMVVAMQYYARHNFVDYIHKVESIRLSELSQLLQEEYHNSGGWQRLHKNPQLWRKLLRPRDSAAYAEKPPSMPSGFESYLKPPPPPRERRGEGQRDRGHGFSENERVRSGHDKSPPP
jgi:hypothetical protein